MSNKKWPKNESDPQDVTKIVVQVRRGRTSAIANTSLEPHAEGGFGHLGEVLVMAKVPPHESIRVGPWLKPPQKFMVRGGIGDG
jgi:hypothetical protein